MYTRRYRVRFPQRRLKLDVVYNIEIMKNIVFSMRLFRILLSDVIKPRGNITRVVFIGSY